MKRLLSIILLCIMLFSTFSVINVLAVSESTAKNELIELLQYYCWDFDFTPEFWYEIYTKESYDTYLSAKQKADKLLADENATDEEFENMILEFQTAQKNLVRLDVTIPEETTSPSTPKAKEKLIDLLQYYCWDFDFTPEFWYEIYTKESYDAYLSAKQKADKLLADENTTDEEFENMILEFQTAQKNLVRIDVTIPEETLSTTENTELTEKTEVTEITEPTINTNTSSTEPTSISNTTPTKNNSTVDEATTSTTTTISTNSDTVKTGYNQNIFILITLLMCSMGIVIITTIKNKTSK